MSATHEMSAPEERASMKALVPDLAIVPRLLTRSALVTGKKRLAVSSLSNAHAPKTSA